jgi:cell division protein FtsB
MADNEDGQSRSSRVRRFIVVLEKAAGEDMWNETALERVGVPVRQLRLRAEGVPYLVQLTTTSTVKFRGTELCRRLLASEEFPGVQRVLTASGDTKDEFKELEAKYFPVQRRETKREADVQVCVRDDTVKVGKADVRAVGMDNVCKADVQAVGKDDVCKADVHYIVRDTVCKPSGVVEHTGGWPSTGMSWILNCTEAVGTAGEKTNELKALAGQNTQLAEENKALEEQNKALEEQNKTLEQQTKSLTKQNKLLAKDNAHWMERKASFDRLTLCYAEWRFDLKTKDDEIARLKGENATLAKELALMTERRDTLMRRAAGKE